LDAILGREMIRSPIPWLVLASLLAVAMPAHGQEASPPLPDRNPGRGDTPTPDRRPIPRDVAEAPAPERKPAGDEAAEAPAPEQKPAGDEAAEAPAPERKPSLPEDLPTLPWQSPKVNDALAACAKMLEGVTLDYEQLAPIRRGACGAPAPILVKSIGADPAVVIDPPATMRCKLAVALNTWLKD